MKSLTYSSFIAAIADSYPDNPRVSKDFIWNEFFNSDTARRLCVSNIPLENYIFYNIAYLVHYVLQPLRERCGAIKINSGYRCVTVNEAVDGHKDSYHLYGRAADIVPLHCSLSVLENFIKDLGIKYIRYSTFIHVQI